MIFFGRGCHRPVILRQKTGSKWTPREVGGFQVLQIRPFGPDRRSGESIIHSLLRKNTRSWKLAGFFPSLPNPVFPATVPHDCLNNDSC